MLDLMNMTSYMNKVYRQLQVLTNEYSKLELILKLMQRCLKLYKNIELFIKIFKLIDKKHRLEGLTATWNGNMINL